MTRRSLLIIFAPIIIGACASASGGNGSSTSPRDRNLITAEEIAGLNVATAFDIVRQLRPEFLRSRGTMSMRQADSEFAVVYMNGMRMGGPDQLHQIRATDVQAIRYISAADATTRWGTGHTGGVIEVVVKS